MGDPVFHQHKNRSKVGRWVLSHGIPGLSFLLSFFGERICLFISTKPRGGGVTPPNTDPTIQRYPSSWAMTHHPRLPRFCDSKPFRQQPTVTTYIPGGSNSSQISLARFYVWQRLGKSASCS